ncbi:MAG: hypothetical protein R3C60_12040 [Parvularculaceae bacterium]
MKLRWRIIWLFIFLMAVAVGVAERDRLMRSFQGPVESKNAIHD